ncbi:MAG: hypothetical protein M1839_008174 [Geoglossum umbratile]|nr:MAG: hypothetical protein M1839_008174 [Geoglossum umbratile]
MPALSPPVLSFGTINGGGQMAEHERITRDALACPPGVTSKGDCFEPVSIDQLAGKSGNPGAVGAPDTDETFSSLAHCDDADYLDFAKYHIPGTYPRTRAEATSALLDCIAHLSGRFSDGLTASKDLLDGKGRIAKKETNLDGNDCTFFLGVSGRAKCNAIEGLGRALHGHPPNIGCEPSWASPTRIVVCPRPRSAMTPAGFTVPPDLSTGCFIISGIDKSGANECIKQGRITHVTLNKDEGVINIVPSVPPGSPLTSAPKTPRGTIGTNFELAIQGAILETRRQWADFRAELVSRYGPAQASLMVCALTRDHPWKDCVGRKIALVIDSSGSNQDTDPSNLRIAAAQEFDATLITKDAAGPDDLPDLVTVIDFDEGARVVYPLGDPASASFAGIDSDGGTFIAGGISLAIDKLVKDTTDPTQDHTGIVVFTDGQDSDISSLLAALNGAAQLGIRVSFGFLSPPPNPIARREVRRSSRIRPRDLYPRQSDDSSPPELLAAVLKTGGVFGTINSAEAQHSFVKLVIARGPTNIDSISPSNGGPLFPGVTVVALSSAARGPDVFTYHATAGQNLTFETQTITSPVLNVTLHDVRGSKDLKNAATNATGTATIVYEAPTDIDLQLIVSPAATGGNPTGLYSVKLQLPAGGSNGACSIAAGSPCQTTGEMKCCGTGFITCDHGGYVFRDCGPGSACKSNGSNNVYWPPSSGHPYRSLRLDQPEIRLVTVAPGSGNARIHCQLRHASLTDNPEYEALSYVWGDPSDTRPISLDGQVFQVTANLHAALRRLRHRTKKVFWIDAICINQSDPRERAHQVHMMRDIFSSAKRVVAWLREADENGRVGLGIMATMRQQPWCCRSPGGLRQFYSVLWGCLLGIFDRPYWKRVWVVQELAVARNCQVVCGDNRQSLEEHMLVISILLYDSVASAHQDPVLSGAEPLACTSMGQLILHYQKRKEVGLLELIISTSEFEATDPRDKIYALLGLSSAAARESIIPEYCESKTMPQVSADLVEYFITKEKSLDIILGN